MPNPQDPEVFELVRSAFAEALGLDDDEVEYDSRIIEDLGAESLDLLDIVFRLERAFDIRIPRGGIESAVSEAMDDGEQLETHGVLTAEGLRRLQTAMPEIPVEDFKPGLKVSEIPLLFRVSTFCRLVCELLETRESGEEATA
jgi:acyl carrier protein